MTTKVFSLWYLSLILIVFELEFHQELHAKLLDSIEIVFSAALKIL